MRGRAAGVRYPVWLWPNLLSLDAPVIAVVWQTFLAACYHVPLRAAGRVALFLAVWAIYIADRLLDARRPAAPAEPARHVFYREHRKLAQAVLAVLVIAGAIVAAVWLRPRVLHNGLIPFAAVLLYLGVLHVTGSQSGMAKEPLVAFIFTTGTFLVAWTNDPVSPIALLRPALAFFLLCLANLTAIEVWEWRELRTAGERPHPVTALLVRGIYVWPPLLALVAFLAGHPWYYAIAISAAAISALIWIGRRLPIELRRVLVDLALLSPLLFLFTML
jgi:hypothetical protein